MDSPCRSVSHLLFSGIATEPFVGVMYQIFAFRFGWLNPPHRQCNTQSNELLPHLTPLFFSCQGWPNVCTPCPQLSQISACRACTHWPTSRPVGWLRGNTSDQQHSRPERRPWLGRDLVTLVRPAGLAGPFLMCQHLCKNMSQLQNTDLYRESERLASRHSHRCFLNLSLYPRWARRGKVGEVGRALAQLMLISKNWDCICRLHLISSGGCTFLSTKVIKAAISVSDLILFIND